MHVDLRRASRSTDEAFLTAEGRARCRAATILEPPVARDWGSNAVVRANLSSLFVHNARPVTAAHASNRAASVATILLWDYVVAPAAPRPALFTLVFDNTRQCAPDFHRLAASIAL